MQKQQAVMWVHGFEGAKYLGKDHIQKSGLWVAQQN